MSGLTKIAMKVVNVAAKVVKPKTQKTNELVLNTFNRSLDGFKAVSGGTKHLNALQNSIGEQSVVQYLQNTLFNGSKLSREAIAQYSKNMPNSLMNELAKNHKNPSSAFQNFTTELGAAFKNLGYNA